MNLIDGKALAAKIQAGLKEKVPTLPVQPGLLVVLVGEDPASQAYVRNKARVASEIGIKSETLRLPDTTIEAELLELVAHYNQDKTWHGILVQLPLPAHIDEQQVLLTIDPAKDVDGFHPINMGRLWAGNPMMVPATPAGVMAMLHEYNVTISGKYAVVVGASNIVGKPMAQMLLAEGATVTIGHTATQDLAKITREAEVLVVAIGDPRFITREYVRPGAVVIDVGVNYDAAGKICGDVDFEAVKEIASLITPVPGGVGPVTIAMLMEQTVRAAERAISFE